MTTDLLRELVPSSMASMQRALICTAVLFCIAVAWTISKASKKALPLPIVNEIKSFWYIIRVKKNYVQHARQLLADGFRKFQGPFVVNTENGPLIMLPPSMIDAVNAEPNLSFNEYGREHHLTNYETFRALGGSAPGLFEGAVMRGLTRSLPKFTTALSEEMASCLTSSWTQLGDGWHEVDVKKDVLQWVARLSARIFLPKSFSESKEWCRISIEFTTSAFIGMAIVRFLPKSLRWPAERFLPICRRIRAESRAAAKMLTPVLEERHREIAAAQAEGRKPQLPDDSIEWFRTSANGRPYNEVDVQIALALAAVHTTSDLLVQALLNLASHPDILPPVRQEAVHVLSQHGWQKTALTELRLLDSFLKETQRLKPVDMATMHRVATTDVELSNNVRIPRGQATAISSHEMWSENNYEDPAQFDAFRYVKRRQIPGLEHKSYLVATSPDHLGFAHGKHACPGRFFAANEVKIALVHLILNYDFKLEDPSHAVWKEYGTAMFTNPQARLSIRRRKPEIELEAL